MWHNDLSNVHFVYLLPASCPSPPAENPSEQQQLLCKHPVNSSTEVASAERHGNPGLVLVAAKSNLQTHNAELISYFSRTVFLLALAATGLRVALSTVCDRWSERRPVKVNAAALRGEWVGSGFLCLN